MLSLQTILIAEEIQKDALRRAEQRRLLRLLPTQQIMPGVSLGKVAGWLRAGMTIAAQTWQNFFGRSAASSPCPTC